VLQRVAVRTDILQTRANKTRPILMQNQMMMTTKALASLHSRSALLQPSKQDPKILEEASQLCQPLFSVSRAKMLTS